jgi:hypothetical protein
MGYTIPSGDYSLPPLQVNVGAELGKSFGAGLAAYGARKDKERKEAAQLLKDQDATKNTIAINQAEALRKFGSDLQAKGVPQILIEQYQARATQMGRAAMQAQLDMEFGQDMTDEQRMQNATIVADVTNYTTSTLTQMGALASDLDVVNDTDYVVYGDDTNGEQLANTFGLNAFKGSMISPDAIINGNLTGEGNINDIGSTVSIPVNSPYWDTAKSAGGTTVMDQVKKGLSLKNGRVKEQEIEGKKYYTFTTDVNLNNYESSGGVDLVQKKLPTLESDKTLQAIRAMDEVGAWSKAYVDQNPVTTFNQQLDNNGVPTGYRITKSYNIVDVNKIIGSKPYQDEIKAEYDAVFNSNATPPISRFVQQNYLRRIGSSLDMNSEEWKNARPEDRRDAVMSDITEKLWEGYFPPSKNKEGDGASQEQMILDKDTPIEILSKAKSMVNPLTSQNYKEGDTIYLIKDQKTRQDNGEGSNSVDQYSAFLQMTDTELMEALKSAPLSVTSRGTFQVIGDKLLRNDGSELTSNFPQVSMPAFRAMLRKASATERNK